MDIFVRYNRIVVTLIAIPLMVLLYAAMTMQAVTGDLTRTGGFSDDKFGWNDPQERFEKMQYYLANTVEEYDRYYDVVVLGDSFSIDGAKGWQNYFIEHTGMSVITFYIAKGITLEDIVSSPQYQRSPPKLLIYQTVERRSFFRLHDFAEKKWPMVNNLDSLPELLHKDLVRHQYAKKDIYRSIGAPLEKRISFATNFLSKEFQRRLGRYRGNTLVYPLMSDGLFSSKESAQLLVTIEDTDKDVSVNSVKRAVLGLKKGRTLVESNGKTRFQLLIFPDKLTVYKEYLSDSTITVKSYIPALAEHFDFVRLDKVFSRQLELGARDLYLPNDTHTGYLGYKLAALSLIDFIFK